MWLDPGCIVLQNESWLESGTDGSLRIIPHVENAALSFEEPFEAMKAIKGYYHFPKLETVVE